MKAYFQQFTVVQFKNFPENYRLNKPGYTTLTQSFGNFKILPRHTKLLSRYQGQATHSGRRNANRI